MYPAAKQLIETGFEDEGYIVKFKQELLSQIEERVKENSETYDFLLVAALLDPYKKKLKHIKKDQRPRASELLLREMRKVAPSEGTLISTLY